MLYIPKNVLLWFFCQTSTGRQALLTDLRKRETRTSLRRSQLPPKKPPPSLPPGAEFGKPDPSDRHSSALDYLTGGAQIYQNDPPSRHSHPAWSGNTSPKPPLGKVPRSLSSEGLLSRNSSENVPRRSPGGSPTLRKQLLENPKPMRRSADSDNDYEEMAPIEVTPYAIHDVVPTTGRELTNGKRNLPERPAPPLKCSVTTLKSRDPPPVVIPRGTRAKTVSLHGSAYDQMQAPPLATSLPTPRESPPRPKRKPPASPKPVRNKTNGNTKEVSRYI